MSDVVLDASALLAVLYCEPRRSEIVSLYLENALILSVNLCEVLSNAQDRGIPLDEAQKAIARFSFRIIPANEEIAFLAAKIRKDTREFGLSLGDRFCLALAVSRQAKVITTDSLWAKVDLGIKIVVAK